MITRKVSPALAAGCTVVLKPSELTPLTGKCPAVFPVLCFAAQPTPPVEQHRHVLSMHRMLSSMSPLLLPTRPPAAAAFALVELAERAGVPPGALNVLSGAAQPISDALMESEVVSAAAALNAASGLLLATRLRLASLDISGAALHPGLGLPCLPGLGLPRGGKETPHLCN